MEEGKIYARGTNVPVEIDWGKKPINIMIMLSDLFLFVQKDWSQLNHQEQKVQVHRT